MCICIRVYVYIYMCHLVRWLCVWASEVGQRRAGLQHLPSLHNSPSTLLLLLFCRMITVTIITITISINIIIITFTIYSTVTRMRTKMLHWTKISKEGGDDLDEQDEEEEQGPTLLRNQHCLMPGAGADRGKPSSFAFQSKTYKISELQQWGTFPPKFH